MSVLMQTGLVMATGALAAMTALPATRRLGFGDVAYDWLAGELEFDHIHNDGQTIVMKSGVLCRVIRLDGLSYDGRVDAEVGNLSLARAATLGRLGNAGVTVRLFAVKRETDLSYGGNWPEGPLSEIGAAEEARFAHSFEVRWYMVIQHKLWRQLDEASTQALSLLVEYLPRILERDAGSEDGHCELTAVVNYLLTGELRDGQLSVSDNISARIGFSDLGIDADGTVTTRLPDTYLHRIIAVRGWPGVISGMLVGDLLRLPFEIEICQVCRPEAKPAMQVIFSQKARESRALAMLGGGARAEEYDDALDALGDDETALFQTQMMLTVRAGSAAGMEDALRRVTDILGRHRVLFSLETRAAGVAWFNRIPGHEKLLRPLKLFSGNIAAIWPFHAMVGGMRSSPWGDQPVRLLSGESGQSYAFQFHASPAPQSIGHYLVLAPTGGGKTTLMMHLLGGLSKLAGVRSYVFDSREGTRFMVEALGGQYLSYDRLELNPLDVDDTLAARHRISLIVRSMLGEHGRDDDVAEIVDQLLSVTFAAEPEHRTFNEVFPMAFGVDSPARRAFLPWVTDVDGHAGLHAHVFNAPRDSLAATLDRSFLTGINMNEALSDPELGPPVVTHIMNAISASAARNSTGFNIFIDEAANLLGNAGFRDAAVEMYREYRKLNGVVGMAFQDPAALHASGIAEAIIDNTATLIIFPNPLAKAEEYAPFNLNEEQLNFITGRHDGRKVLLVRRDGPSGLDETVILDVDLAWLGDALRFYRSGSDAVNELTAIQAAYPDDWQERL